MSKRWQVQRDWMSSGEWQPVVTYRWLWRARRDVRVMNKHGNPLGLRYRIIDTKGPQL